MDNMVSFWTFDGKYYVEHHKYVKEGHDPREYVKWWVEMINKNRGTNWSLYGDMTVTAL